MKELHFTESDHDEIIKITKAIGSATRLKIVQLLVNQELDISRLAETLNQTEANVSAQVNQLEKAGLIESRYEPGTHGVRKINKTAVSKITIVLKS